MLLRLILSRIHKHKRFATLCSVENAEPSTAAIPPSPSTTKYVDNGYVISYLIKQCGLTQDGAISASKRVQFDSPNKPNAVLSFLEEKGFSKAQIAVLVAKKPGLLVADPEKTLLKRFEFYTKLIGTSEADIMRALPEQSFFFEAPRKNIVPAYNYLRGVIGIERARTLLVRRSWIYKFNFENRLIPNVELLRVLRVPESCIALGLYNFPSVFTRKPDEFKGTVEEVRQMGFDLSKAMFILAIHVKSRAVLWDKRFQSFVRWGWTEDDVYKAFRKHPLFMTMSERKVSKIFDFLAKVVGKEARLVAECPQILLYNFEKRIVPRCSVVHHLASQGLHKKDWSLGSVLNCKEEDFLEKFVKRFEEEVPCLRDLYIGKTSVVDA